MTIGKLSGLAIRALSICAIASGAIAADTPCSLRQIGELPLTYAGGDLVVDAAINGTPMKMAIDTGSFATSIFRPTADKLGLRMKEIQGVTVYGVGGSDKLYEVGVKELKVAGLVAHNMDLSVTGGRTFGDVGGLLGVGFIFQSDVEFDVAGGKLRFFKPQHCAGDQVVYWGKAYSVAPLIGDPRHQLLVDVKLGDGTVRAVMDSGAPKTTVNRQSAARYATRDVAVQAAENTYGVGRGSVETSVAMFPSFSFGDETIRNAKLNVADLFHADREVRLGSRIAEPIVEETTMLIGADFFRSHRIYVSLGQKKVYVSYVGGPVFDTRAAAPSSSAPAK